MIKTGQQAALCKKDGSIENVKISRLYVFSGLKRIEADSAMMETLLQSQASAILTSVRQFVMLMHQNPYLLLR